MPLTIDDIASVLHLNLEAAAKKLNVSVASLKRACRRFCLSRWPYRKLRAVKRRTKMLKSGEHLTPSESTTLERCQQALLEVRETVFSHFSEVPALDTIMEAELRNRPTLTNQPVILDPISLPVQVSLQNVSPALTVDCMVQQTVRRYFLPSPRCNGFFA